MMKPLVALALVAVASTTAVQAQSYPSHPITMIVPFPAGSAFDVAARVLAENMQSSLGQPIIVEDATGAAGSAGSGRVARASGDG